MMPVDSSNHSNPASDATSPSGVLERLRAATHAAHESIESVPAFKRLLGAQLNPADYAEFLQQLHAFHAGLQAALEQALRGRSQAQALLDGGLLAALGEDLAWFRAAPLPARPPASPLTSVGSALGALYVIEGSNLGGRIIGRQVAMTLNVSPGRGGSYHCGFTETAVWRWRLLQLVLAQEIDAAGAPWAPVTAGAAATFAALEKQMRDYRLPSGGSMP